MKRKKQTSNGRKPTRTRATKAIIQARVEEVLRIRLDGAEFWDLREYARDKEKEPGSAWELKRGERPLSDGQLWRYIAKANKLVAESSRASRGRLLRQHLAMRRNLYAKAVSQGDVRAALAAADSEAKLRGLFPTPEDALRKEIEGLRKQLAEAGGDDGGDGGPAGGN